MKKNRERGRERETVLATPFRENNRERERESWNQGKGKKERNEIYGGRV